MYSREEIKALTDKVLNLTSSATAAKVDGAEVSFDGGERAGTRWANSTITTNLVQYDQQISITVRVGAKSGNSTTREFDDESLKTAVDEAADAATKARDNPNLPPLVKGPQTYIPVDAALPAMVEFGPGDRAKWVKQSIDICEKNGVLAAGYIPKAYQTNCIANSEGLFAYYQYAEAGFVLTCRMPAGSGSGWSGITGAKDLSQTNVAALTQVASNKAPVSPNRGYSRMQHLWFTERVIDIVAHELELDPVEVRKRNYIKTEEMPYTTPNGCVYDSGDYSQMLDIALELVDYAGIEARRADAAARGKLLGLGIGSTLDSGTNNFGQSRMINPELQFSGNNEVATVKLDIFGEIVVTLGTTPQGQGHETTAAQVVADILGCSIDDVYVRAGHDTYWNSHAGFSGTYASQFAVTGLSAVKGATDMLAEQIKKLGSVIFGGVPVRRSSSPKARAHQGQPGGAAFPSLRRDHQHEQRRAARGSRRHAQLPLRLPAAVRVPDIERVRQPRADVCAQVHAPYRDRSRDGLLRDRRLRGRGRLRQAHQPADRRRPGDGRDRAGARRRDARDLRVRRRREPADAELLRLPRPARARHAAASDRVDREPVTVHAARHEGHGRGRRRRDPRRVRRDPGRAARQRQRDRLGQLESVPARVGDARSSGDERWPRPGGRRMIVEGERTFDAPRRPSGRS